LSRALLTPAPQLTDVFEGSVIRVFRRLQELLRQMVQASKAIGNDELADKVRVVCPAPRRAPTDSGLPQFEASLKVLEREGSIIFSPSLYL